MKVGRLEDFGSLLSKMAWTWPLSTDTANIPVELSDEFSGDTESFAANYAFDPQDVGVSELKNSYYDVAGALYAVAVRTSGAILVGRPTALTAGTKRLITICNQEVKLAAIADRDDCKEPSANGEHSWVLIIDAAVAAKIEEATEDTTNATAVLCNQVGCNELMALSGSYTCIFCSKSLHSSCIYSSGLDPSTKLGVCSLECYEACQHGSPQQKQLATPELKANLATAAATGSGNDGNVDGSSDEDGGGGEISDGGDGNGDGTEHGGDGDSEADADTDAGADAAGGCDDGVIGDGRETGPAGVAAAAATVPKTGIGIAQAQADIGEPPHNVTVVQAHELTVAQVKAQLKKKLTEIYKQKSGGQSQWLGSPLKPVCFKKQYRFFQAHTTLEGEYLDSSGATVLLDATLEWEDAELKMEGWLQIGTVEVGKELLLLLVQKDEALAFNKADVANTAPKFIAVRGTQADVVGEAGSWPVASDFQVQSWLRGRGGRGGGRKSVPIPREPVLPEWCDDQPELVCGLGWQLAVTGIFQNCADSKNEHGAANTFSTKKAKTRATKDRPKRPQRGKKTDDDTTRAPAPTPPMPPAPRCPRKPPLSKKDEKGAAALAAQEQRQLKADQKLARALAAKQIIDARQAALATEAAAAAAEAEAAEAAAALDATAIKTATKSIDLAEVATVGSSEVIAQLQQQNKLLLERLNQQHAQAQQTGNAANATLGGFAAGQQQPPPWQSQQFASGATAGAQQSENSFYMAMLQQSDAERRSTERQMLAVMYDRDMSNAKRPRFF